MKKLDIENIGKKLKEAELRKLNAEIKKINTEADYFEKTNNIPWYKSQQWIKIIIQSVVAGIIAIPVIWFFYNEIGYPLSQSQNIQLSLKNELQSKSLKAISDSLNMEKYRFKEHLNKLDSLKVSYINENNSMIIENERIKIQLQNKLKTIRDSLNVLRKDKTISYKISDKLEYLSSINNLFINELDANDKSLKIYSANLKSKVDILVSDFWKAKVYNLEPTETISYNIIYSGESINTSIEFGMSLINMEGLLIVEIIDIKNPEKKYYSEAGVIMDKPVNVSYSGDPIAPCPPICPEYMVSNLVFRLNKNILKNNSLYSLRIVNKNNI